MSENKNERLIHTDSENYEFRERERESGGARRAGRQERSSCSHETGSQDRSRQAGEQEREQALKEEATGASGQGSKGGQGSRKRRQGPRVRKQAREQVAKRKRPWGTRVHTRTNGNIHTGAERARGPGAGSARAQGVQRTGGRGTGGA